MTPNFHPFYRRHINAILLGSFFAPLLAFTPFRTAEAQGVATQDRRAFADGLLSRGLAALALPEYQALAADASTPERDVVLFRLAECQRQTGDAKGAEKSCAELLSKYPSSAMAPRARLTRGLILKDTGKNADAASVLDDLATDTAASPDLSSTALYHAADARERSGNRKAAATRYTELVKRAEAQGASKTVRELGAYARLRIAALRALDDDPEATNEALRTYDAIAANPFSQRIGAEAVFQSAGLLYRQGKYDASAARYAQLASKFPNDDRVAEARIPAAWAFYRAGRHADALSRATPLAETPSPVQLEAAYIKANALAQLSRRKDAVAAYDALLALRPANDDERKMLASARYERIVVLFKDGQFQRALDDAASVTAPSGLEADFIWLQAQAAEALKDEARAVQFYRMLVQKAPKDRLAPEALYRLAYSLQSQGSWLEASRNYLALASSFPDNALVPQALYSSGVCLARAGKTSEALRDWNDLISRFPNDKSVPDALFQKAMAEIRASMAREAGADLDALLALGNKVAKPLLAEANFWRARIFYDARDLDAAKRHLDAAFHLGPSPEIRGEAAFLMGLVLQAEGHEAEAAAYFQPLVSAPSGAKFSDDRLAWLSDFQFSRGEFAASRDAAKELASRATTDEWRQAGNTLLGRAFTALASTNDAIAAYRLAADSKARTKYSSESALHLGELLMAQDDASARAEAADYLSEAVARASSQELAPIRARAYFALAECAMLRGRHEEGARYYMALALLFDDPELVPKALTRAAEAYDRLGMKTEADAARAELAAR